MKPLDALGSLLDEPVMVRLKNGMVIKGKLKAFDIHINLVLTDASYKDNDVEKKFNQIFLRGDMVISIS